MLQVKSIRPVYTRLITTANRYTESQKNGVLLDASKLEGRYKEYQTVVKVGSSVREVKEGEVVLIDPSRYMKRKYMTILLEKTLLKILLQKSIFQQLL